MSGIKMKNLRITFLPDGDNPSEVKICGYGFIDDHTICGLSTEVSTIPDSLSTETVDLPIDCLQCIAVIQGCKAIPARNIKSKR